MFIELFVVTPSPQYPGENNKASILAFLADPQPEAAAKPREEEWAEEESEVAHLTDDTFDRWTMI